MFNRRILLSLAAVSFAITLLIGATVAFFSDNETSQNNVLVAGAVDLKIDNTSYINGVPNPDTTWTLNDLTDQLFFNFTDIKPSDLGEDTISLHAQNDCWVCMEITLTANDDNTCTEPENIDDPTCPSPPPEPDNDLFDGELAQNVNFIFWADDGDNVLEEGEEIFEQGTAQDVLDNNLITLADSTTNNLGGIDTEPMQGGNDELGQPIINYIGKAWCFGTLTPDAVPFDQGVSPTVDGGVDCDGSTLNNATQTDKLLADIKFTAVQARNNPGFLCQPGASPSPSSSPIPSPSPTPLCGQADVMLVLDRSGSINATELGLLKTAATDFVTSLGLTPTGIHAGQTSFSTNGTLDQILTDSEASVDAAINALVNGGFTNLKAGIDLATGELTGANDRADGTSPDKMIIITDGHPNRPFPSSTADDVAEAAADAARALGIEVFVVGVGSDVNTAFLQNEIANTGAGHYFSVGDYSGLETVLQNLDFCQDEQ